MLIFWRRNRQAHEWDAVSAPAAAQTSGLIQAAHEYIERLGDTDLLIFHSTVRGFYEHLGFEPMNDMVTLGGDPHHPRRSNDTGFMRFLSEKGKKS